MTPLNFDDCVTVVADAQRRRLLEQLRREAPGPIHLEVLADKLRRGETNEIGGRSFDSRDVAIELHHRHLPTLANHDLVHFDVDRRTVRYLPDEHVELILDSLPDEHVLARQ